MDRLYALGYDSATTTADYADPALRAYNIAEYIGVMISVILGLLGIIFLVLTIYAGLLWMTAGGNGDQVKKAQQILGNAVIGLILTLSSYAITYFVIGYVS